MVPVLNLIAYSILKTATENVRFGCQMNHRMDDAPSFRNIAFDLQVESAIHDIFLITIL